MDKFMIAQIVGILVTVSSILAVQFKNMKWILVGQIVSNLLLALNLALLGGLSGSGICMTATVHSITVFILNTKGKKLPTEASILFAAAYTACSAIAFQSGYDVLSCLAALIYAMSVIQEKSSVYRVYMIANSILWVIYDMSVGAYTTILTYVFILISIGIAIYRHDLDDWKKFLNLKKDAKSGGNQ